TLTLTRGLSPPSLHDALPIWADTGSHNGRVALGTADQLIRIAFGAGSAHGFSGQAADPFSIDCIEFDRDAHENDNERRDFHGCRSEEHTSELQSRVDLVCRLL